MHEEPGWLMTCRVVLVIGVAEIAASIIPGHTNWAYFGGLLLGWALEILTFPRQPWRRGICGTKGAFAGRGICGTDEITPIKNRVRRTRACVSTPHYACPIPAEHLPQYLDVGWEESHRDGAFCGTHFAGRTE
jgi:hypothetical protein